MRDHKGIMRDVIWRMRREDDKRRETQESQRENCGESISCCSGPIFQAGKSRKTPFFALCSTETLATQAMLPVTRQRIREAYVPFWIVVHMLIECVRCHAIKNKIKNYATDKVKKL